MLTAGPTRLPRQDDQKDGGGQPAANVPPGNETPAPQPAVDASQPVPQTDGGAPGCVPAAGPSPSASNCVAYAQNGWWLPVAYVVNATCACLKTPDGPTSNCVRKFLQDRLAGTPSSIKAVAVAARAAQAAQPIPGPGPYDAFVQTVLTPRIYQDHVDAYQTCCCPSGPAPYPAWVGVTTVPIPECDIVRLTINYFGSCHGTPGAW